MYQHKCTYWKGAYEGRLVMCLHHEVVEFLLGELRQLLARPRVLVTHAPVFDAIPILAIVAAHVRDGSRRAQQVDHQFGIDGSLQGWERWNSAVLKKRYFLPGQGSEAFVRKDREKRSGAPGAL